ALRICWYLLNQYARIFDILYSDYQQSQGRIVSNNFDPIELLTIHSYADNIEKRREE
ncbi:2013_t:CDS:1, partial [Scutellospora calospora]